MSLRTLIATWLEMASHADLKVVALSSGRQVQRVDTQWLTIRFDSIGNILSMGLSLAWRSLQWDWPLSELPKVQNARKPSHALLTRWIPANSFDWWNNVTAGRSYRVDPGACTTSWVVVLDEGDCGERLVVLGFLGSCCWDSSQKEVRDVLQRRRIDKALKGRNYCWSVEIRRIFPILDQIVNDELELCSWRHKTTAVLEAQINTPGNRTMQCSSWGSYGASDSFLWERESHS